MRKIRKGLNLIQLNTSKSGRGGTAGAANGLNVA